MQDEYVVVKCTRRCWTRANLHQLCAERGHGPKLFGYGIARRTACCDHGIGQTRPFIRIRRAHALATVGKGTYPPRGRLPQPCARRFEGCNLIVLVGEPGRIMLVDYDLTGKRGDISFRIGSFVGSWLGGRSERAVKSRRNCVLRTTLEKLKPSSLIL